MSVRNAVVLIAAVLMTTACKAKEWRLTVLIDGAGLSKEAYRQIYKALTTEWPAKDYSLPVEGVSTKETVALQTVLFGIEKYTIGTDQYRFMPLSGQGKTVSDTEITVKDCATDSLIDTIVERHKRLKEQFREQVETAYLATSDGVLLLSLCPNLGNFQNGISSTGKMKLQTIKLAWVDTFVLNSAVLSQDIKSARGAYDARVTKAVLDPANPDRMLEKLAKLQIELVASKDKTETLTGQLLDVNGQLEKTRKSLAEKGEELAMARDAADKVNRANAEAVESLKKQFRDSMSNASTTAEEKRQLQEALKAAVQRAQEDSKKGAETVEAAQHSVAVATEAAKITDGKVDTPIVEPVEADDTKNVPSDGWVNGLIMLLVLGGAGFAVWRLLPHKTWTVTIERDGAPETELIVVGKSAKPFSFAGDMGTAGSLQIRYLRQTDIDTEEKKDIFQLKAPVEGWSVDSGTSKTVLPPGEWCAALEANIRYAVYTDTYAETPSVRFTVEERA
jgi:hypothetical protein